VKAKPWLAHVVLGDRGDYRRYVTRFQGNVRYPTPDPRDLEAIMPNPGLDTPFVFMQAAGVGFTLNKR
jgi:hypothetical protein